MNSRASFARGIPRLAVLVAVMAGLCLVPLQMFSRGPNLCLWRHLFRLSACPACGSTRALCAFFHGQFAQALAFNRNVIVTAPTLVSLFVLDIFRAARR